MSRVSPLEWDEIRHGSYLGYSSDGCRCQLCRDAKAAYLRDRRAQGVEVDVRPNHGRRVNTQNLPPRAEAEHHLRALRHLKDVHNPPRRACADCRELFAEGNLR